MYSLVRHPLIPLVNTSFRITVSQMRAPGTKTDKHRLSGTAKNAQGDDDDVAVVKIRRRKGPLIKLHGPPAMGDKGRDATARGEDEASGKGKKKRGEGYGARTDYTATGIMMTMRPGSPGSPSSSSPTKEMIEGTTDNHTSSHTFTYPL